MSGTQKNSKVEKNILKVMKIIYKKNLYIKIQIQIIIYFNFTLVKIIVES